MIGGEETPLTPKPIKTSPSHDNIEIRTIQLNEHDAILNFLRQHYYHEEPLTIGNTPKQQDPEDEKFNMSQIGNGTSLMAVQKIVENDETNNSEQERIIGVLLSGPKSSNEAEHLFEEAARLKHTKWGKILGILAHAERDSNVFERYNVAKALHVHVIGVDARMRGRSIGLRLMKALIQFGRSLNYPLLTLDCSSYYSAKLCERLKMDCVNIIKYEQYLDNDGKPVFAPPSIHEELKTFAARL